LLQGPRSSHEAKSLAQSARLILGGLLSRPAMTPDAAGCNALQTHCGQLGSSLVSSGLDSTTVCTIDPVFQRVFARLLVTPSLGGRPSRWALKPLKVPWGQPRAGSNPGPGMQFLPSFASPVLSEFQLRSSQMSIGASQILGAVTIGIGATLVMDLARCRCSCPDGARLASGQSDAPRAATRAFARASLIAYY
jgi:hypothetical protein